MTPIYKLIEWAAAQASPWFAHNQALRLVEAVDRGSVTDRDLTDPPVACDDGASYLVAAGGTGAWAGHDGEFAVAVGLDAANGWLFADIASEGKILWVEDEAVRLQYTGGAWDVFPSGGTASGLNYDADIALGAGAASDTKLPTQLAVKSYVDGAVAGLLDLKGNIDASANPDYPAAQKGDAYVISAAGKIGGAAGEDVAVGDVAIAGADNAGGTEAAVGGEWFVLEHNNTGGTGISDGDKGDITVSGGGAAFTIDPDAVTYGKMQNVSAASRLLGRGAGAGGGDPEEIQLGSGLAMAGNVLSATGGGGGGGGVTVAVFREEQPSGIHGGASSAGAWTARALNATQYNGIAGANLAASQITLLAGTYYVSGLFNLHRPAQARARLYNVSDGASAIVGQSVYGATGTGGDAILVPLDGVFTIAAAKIFELQYYATVAKTIDGLGIAAGIGVEVFARLTITKIA